MPRDGFIIETFDGEEVGFVPCSKDSERMREKVLGGLLINLRDDCIVIDTRDREEVDADAR